VRRRRPRPDFIDLYIERYLPRHFELKLVPTYRCNLSCGYCYARDFRERFPAEMSWDDFARLAGMLVREDGRTVRVLGGEPTLWEHIDRAIARLRELGLVSIVLTNGTRATREPPDEIHVNVEHAYESRTRAAVLDTLGAYREIGSLVRFRYNIRPREPREKLDWVIDLAGRSGVPSVHMGTAWPHERTRRFGGEVVRAVRAIREGGLACTLGDPVPLCMFSEEEREELRDRANLSGRCMCGHVPLVNPDGRTVFPCQVVDVARPMSEVGALRNVRAAFGEDVERIARDVDGECLSCEHFLAGRCQAGCLGTRRAVRRGESAPLRSPARDCHEEPR
jgi:radical SAM protein with 4Fe4S-binding SPASM domain